MRVRHAFTGYIYEQQDDGNVKVTDPASGRQAVHAPNAARLSGDVLAVDHHLCGHVGGRTAIGGAMMGPPPRPAEQGSVNDPEQTGA